MHAKFEEIQRLYLEQLSGIISDTDKDRLGKCIREDMESRAIWEALDKEGRALQVNETLHAINVAAQLEKMKLQTREKNQSTQKNWLYAAASILLLATFSYLIYTYAVSRPSADMGTTDAGQVRLVLSDGKTVLLDKPRRHSLTVGDIELQFSDNTIKSVRGGSTSESNTLIVPSKKTYRITLPDGTKVTLNALSQLKFPSKFPANQREVSVEGEAYFDVAQQANSPFIVHTTLGNIRVLGTTFNVNTYKRDVLCTSLLSGKVQVRSENGEETTLDPGFEAVFSKGGGINIQTFDTESKLSWINGILYFYDMPLAELNDILPRWFDLKVVFTENTLRKRRISGLVEKDKLATLIENIEHSAYVTCQLKGQTLYIAKK